MNPYAELADLQERFPRALTTEEQNRATVLLADASVLLSVRVPGLAESTDETVLEAAKLVVVAAVSRALTATASSRPDGAESISETAGIYSQNIRFRNPEGNAYFYDSEIGLLADLLGQSAVSYRSLGL